MLTENFEKTDVKQGVIKGDLGQDSSQSAQKSVADMKVSHRAGVLAAIRDFHEQKRAKKAIL
jgi:hypothetical protein